MGLLSRLLRPSRANGIVGLKVVHELAGEWNDADVVRLHQFIHSQTGAKWLANLEHTLYLETMSTKIQSEWDDGRRCGLATAIAMTRQLADKSHLEEDEAEPPA